MFHMTKLKKIIAHNSSISCFRLPLRLSRLFFPNILLLRPTSALTLVWTEYEFPVCNILVKAIYNEQTLEPERILDLVASNLKEGQCNIQTRPRRYGQVWRN